MVIMLVLRWWYGAGWQWAWQRSVTKRIAWLNEAFSMPALVRTWFSPFKQTYSGNTKGSIDTRVQAAIDNFVSRIIGSIARTLIIFAGLFGILLAFLSGVIIFILWPFIPLLPFIAIGLFASGVGV